MFILLILLNVTVEKKSFYFYFDELTLSFGFVKNLITSNAVKFKPLPLRETDVNFIT